MCSLLCKEDERDRHIPIAHHYTFYGTNSNRVPKSLQEQLFGSPAYLIPKQAQKNWQFQPCQHTIAGQQQTTTKNATTNILLPCLGWWCLIGRQERGWVLGQIGIAAIKKLQDAVLSGVEAQVKVCNAVLNPSFELGLNCCMTCWKVTIFPLLRQTCDKQVELWPSVQIEFLENILFLL
jgi:hypothetical protein